MIACRRRSSKRVDSETVVCETPEDTFELGSRLGASLRGGEVVLLHGGLGAGKTLLTKGILGGLAYDTDEVTSPSFTLVNLYKTDNFDVYHIDFWRLDGGTGTADAVGLADLLENESAVLIIEWAEKLGEYGFERKVINFNIEGDGETPRRITISGAGNLANETDRREKGGPVAGAV